MNVIWFASQNESKVKELKELIPEMEIKSLNDLKSNLDIPENEPTFEQNALFKPKVLSELVKGIIIADDSGLSIPELNNFPGIYSARWANPEKDWNNINNMLLEKLLQNGLLND